MAAQIYDVYAINSASAHAMNKTVGQTCLAHPKMNHKPWLLGVHGVKGLCHGIRADARSAFGCCEVLMEVENFHFKSWIIVVIWVGWETVISKTGSTDFW